jgi:hypothetical protein
MKIARANLRDRCRLAVAGIDKHFASEPTIPVDGTSMTPADMKKALQSSIAAADSTQAARAAWTGASSKETALHDSTIALLSSLRSFVVLKFGSQNQATLADFGFTPRTRKAPTAETKAAAAEKSLATRAARHTMGPRQKAKVKGAAAATPTTAPAATPAPTSPTPAVPGTAPKS